MASSLAVSADPASLIYRELMSRNSGDGNDHVLACMIASWQVGTGSMPDWLGLGHDAFACLMRYHFPRMNPSAFAAQARPALAQRVDEVDELVRLILMDNTLSAPSAGWMARIVAVGCMASDHLWQDLGLWSRTDLTALMRHNFPCLAARNIRDMKWKRFLYKQLCEADGIYTCRAPSCDICTDYHVCFGPET